MPADFLASAASLDVGAAFSVHLHALDATGTDLENARDHEALLLSLDRQDLQHLGGGSVLIDQQVHDRERRLQRPQPFVENFRHRLGATERVRAGGPGHVFGAEGAAQTRPRHDEVAASSIRSGSPDQPPWCAFSPSNWAASRATEPGDSMHRLCLPANDLSWRLGALRLTDLWWRYTALGGNQPRSALAAYLIGAAAWPDAEHNILAQALKENLWDLGISSLALHGEHQDARRTTAPATGRGQRAEGRLLPAMPAPAAPPPGRAPAGPSSLGAVAAAQATEAEHALAARTAKLWQRAWYACMAAERAHQRAERTLSLSRMNRELTRLRRARTAQRQRQPNPQALLDTAVNALRDADVEHAPADPHGRIEQQLSCDDVRATPGRDGGWG